MFSRRHANTAYVALGSNLGDRAGHLLMAVRGMLEASLEVTRLSSIYETEAISQIQQPSFLNMVVELGEPLPPAQQLLARLLRVEFALGRTREVKDGPRTIDLDLLLYGEDESDTEFLRLPHPRMAERRFVLEPLVEIAPFAVHPGSGCSVSDLLEALPHNQSVKRWLPLVNEVRRAGK
jgi:2-amino-4-hydroxy-6-hydroxymethyldihydropteridine diphosphokinase